MSLICDEKIFDSVPIKKEVRAVISGIYVLEVKGLHGKPVAAPPAKKKGRFRRALELAQEKAGCILYTSLRLYLIIYNPYI